MRSAASISRSRTSGVFSGNFNRSRIRRMAATALPGSSAIVPAMKASADFASIFSGIRMASGKSLRLWSRSSPPGSSRRRPGHVRHWHPAIPRRRKGTSRSLPRAPPRRRAPCWGAPAPPVRPRRGLPSPSVWFRSPLRFIEHGRRPAHAKELRLRERQEEVSLERPGQGAGVNEGREPVGEQGSEILPVELRQIGKGGAPLPVPRPLVGEQVFGLDPPMTTDEDVLDLTLVE